MPQTTMSQNQPKGLPGLLGDMTPLKNARSAAQTEASAEMRFGIFVKKGAAVDTVLLLTATTNVLAGVVVRDPVYVYPDQMGDTGVKPQNMVNILRHGTIWLVIEGALPAFGDEAHVRAVATGDEVAGAVLKVADGTDTIDISPMITWTGRTDTVEGVLIAEAELAMTPQSLAAADV